MRFPVGETGANRRLFGDDTCLADDQVCQRELSVVDVPGDIQGPDVVVFTHDLVNLTHHEILLFGCVAYSVTKGAQSCKHANQELGSS